MTRTAPRTSPLSLALRALRPILVPVLLWMGRTALEAQAPASLTQQVSFEGQTYTLRMAKESVRSGRFEVKVQGSDGALQPHVPGDVRTYLGTVEGRPDAYAAGVLHPDGQFRARIYFDRGRTVYSLGSAVYGTRGMGDQSVAWPASPTLSPGGPAGATVYGFDVAFDCDSRYFALCGRDVARAVEMVEFSMACTRAQYLAAPMLRPALARVVLRTDAAKDPYASTTGTALLDVFKTVWVASQGDAGRHLAGLVTTACGGGVAWSSTIGTGNAYCVSDSDTDGDFSVVFRHEMAHTWGVRDMQGNLAEGQTIENGNQFARFSGPELEPLLNFRKSKLGILESMGANVTVPLPPYAGLDTVQCTLGERPAPIPVDVMANDFSPNGRTVSLLSFDSRSQAGATLSRGTRDGRDVVIYTPASASSTCAVDAFTYRIRDAAGSTQTGAVAIGTFLRNGLKGYWPLDAATGKTAADLSRSANTGAVSGGAVWTAGRSGGALGFNGTDSHVVLQPLLVGKNRFTATAWIHLQGNSQVEWSGLLYSRGGDTVAGMLFGPGNELRYNWGDSGWAWSSGLTVPASKWVFVALVVEPAQATLYLHDGTTLKRATNVASHPAQGFEGATYLGWEPHLPSRRFKGAMDEVRVYDQSLSEVEIEALSQGRIWAHSPFPLDGTESGAPDLSWVPYPQALRYHVYVGMERSKVEAATPASPEYRGVVVMPRHIPTLAEGSACAWRVDTELPDGTLVQGRTWTFTRTAYQAPAPLGEWTFDEGAGTRVGNTFDPGQTGTVQQAAWAQGRRGAALQFNGVDSVVRLGAGASLSGTLDFSVSLWIKTAATAAGVLIQQRDEAGYQGQYRLMMNGDGTLNWMVFRDVNQFSITTSKRVNDNQWHHVTAVRCGADGFVFIDGESVPAAAGTGPLASLNGTLATAIGRDIRNGSMSFSGLIDEVRIYRSAILGGDLLHLFRSYAASETDTLPPVVSASVEGSGRTFTLSAVATDNVGVVRVAFYVDDILCGTRDQAPFTLSYDASGLSTGTHRLVVRAFDAAGNMGVSPAVSFLVGPQDPFTLSPGAAIALAGAALQFTATGAPAGGLDWTVGAGATITTSGLLTVPVTAPMRAATFTVVATAKADRTRTATATVTLKGLDLNEDGQLDLLDLLVLAREYGQASAASSNFKGTLVVNDEDLSYLLRHL